MRILQLCHHVPFPPRDGGKIAMMNMAKALLASGHEVHQFALNPSRNYSDVSLMPEDLKKSLHFQSASINTDLRISGALRTLFSGQSYNISRFYNKAIEQKLVDYLQKNTFDIIQFETIFCTPYLDAIRKNSKAKIVLRAHNVEHIIWERLAKAENKASKKWYLNLLASRLKKYELNLLSKIDAILAITPVDEEFFLQHGYKGKTASSPLGLDLSDYRFQPFDERKLSLFHLGAMDWMPNVEGVEWFLHTCWPLVGEVFPELRLFLAGRNFPQHLKEAHYPNVICDGQVERASDYMNDKQLMVVPLRSGSGMRVKIIEGLALGKTIISTTIGAEGIAVEDGKNILLADTPEQFEIAIALCLHHPEKAKSIGIEGRKLAEEKYSVAAIGNQITKFYNELF